MASSNSRKSQQAHPWTGGTTIVRRELLTTPPTLFAQWKRRVARSLGYGVILLLPITAWLVPPPPHAKLEDVTRQPRVRMGGGSSVLATVSISVAESELDLGRQLYLQSCASCHGADAQGLPHQGLPLATSSFLTERLDGEMIEFLKRGRAADDPASQTKLLMPPRGSPPLRDKDLMRVLTYLRNVQGQQGVESSKQFSESLSTEDTIANSRMDLTE